VPAIISIEVSAVVGVDMIGEIDPLTYDCEGRRLPPSRTTRKTPRPSDRFISYLAGGDLAVQCGSLDEVQAFLRRCRYVSDREQFGVPEYWLHPRFFERLRKGDCEDFALWTWRQLLAMGLDARLVLGRYGRTGHVWVTFSDSQAHYLFEPTARRRTKLSRLEILEYHPEQSVLLRDGELVWHDHEPRDHRRTTAGLFAILTRISVLLFFSLLRLPGRLVKGIAGRIKARKGDRWKKVMVTVNDKLPGSEELIWRLLESGIPVSEELPSHPAKPLAQGKRLVTFGRGLPPERIRDVLRAAGDCVDFIQITTEFVTLVYLGAYRVTDDGPEAELTSELRAALLRSNLSIADLWATVAAHDHQSNSFKSRDRYPEPAIPPAGRRG